ncbi:MAG: 1-acyl-sn-glycerol-3-phosphate acyltransferase [Deltaproteobacteria bacterium]|nr:1-acyl-sn-glycerol-3-phosphate acyltransferase [Deltaproteobacteria bacterium]
MFVDLDYLNRIKISAVPNFQKVIGHLVLTPNYHLFSKVDIRIDGVEHIPKDENVILAMNHTDRFNYWPLQYKLWKLKEYPYTTVWVKGKYYRNAVLAKMLDWCNLIPVPSMKYLIEEMFEKKVGRRLKEDEYRAIKDLVDGRIEALGAASNRGLELAAQIHDDFMEFIRHYYASVMDRVAELSITAIVEKKLNVIIFPEGTRSTTLGEGKTGMAQLAAGTKTTIVPIGCNNSDALYPGSSPFAKSGQVIYRVGEPLSFDGALRDLRIDEDFKIFSAESREKYEDVFNEITRIAMERINALVDERYRLTLPA